ncbi:F-box/kelch-repeat protein [Hibiscus syriacus]|uniref:F-box/kelch-repeat protein n=1 Tax=Hibiscus syriacus TaxID=106335 RepID=A0A6A2XFL4_HIBSY|nr:F-box/kelch-repeat protein At5g43190-like [Hibiscus syriacus]KAE8660876.1 F-box/kelch-repeat protein [Hibiscus syriacus]
MFQFKGQQNTPSSLKPYLKIKPSQAMVVNTLKSQTRSTEMDPGIWSNLPQELLEHVLCFLPLKTLLNLRCTCKNFNSLVFTPPFVSEHSSASHLSSFLLLSHPQFYSHFPLYDVTIGSWRKLVVPDSLFPSEFNLVSSSNGLLCFSLSNSCSFLVCNMLGKSSRVIQHPFFPFSFGLLTLVSTPKGYKIFMLCSKFPSNYAFVYDSKDHSWTRHDGFQPLLIDNLHQEGAFYKGCLWFSTPEPFSIVCFDLESGRWGNLNTEMPRELTFVRLVSDDVKGKLYLVGGMGRNGISRSVRLWELGKGEKWKELERLPELMCRKFLSVCYHNYEQFYCFWHEGMICVCCHTWPEILYYKVSRRSWHWLPKCPLMPDKWSCGFKWFSFAPHLYALA